MKNFRTPKWNRLKITNPENSLTSTTGRVKMPYRSGDPTIALEARIETTTAKAYLIEPTMSEVKQTWLPKSQVVGMSEPDENGNYVFTVTVWWANKSGITVDG